MKQLFEEYKGEETKYHFNNIQNEIYDAFLKRIGNEAKYTTQADKRLSNEFKCYQDYFNAKVLFPIINKTIAPPTRKHHKRHEEPSATY